MDGYGIPLEIIGHKFPAYVRKNLRKKMTYRARKATRMTDNMKTENLKKLLKEPSVLFNEEAHTYINKMTGEMYTGCTTISEAWDKSFFLGPWYAKEAIEDAKSKIGDMGMIFEGNPTPTAAIAEILDSCKGAAKRIGEIAKQNGTLAHDWINNHIEAKIGNVELLPTPENEEAKNAINAFCAWEKEHQITWLATEEVICSDQYKVAGKLDGIAVIDGITYLVDFKTSKQVSETYCLQTAGYDLMLQEMGFHVAGYLVLRIPKDGKPAETLTITDQKDMEFFRETFLKLREAHKFFVYAANKLKENGKMKVDAVQVVEAAVSVVKEAVKKIDKKKVLRRKVKKSVKK